MLELSSIGKGLRGYRLAQEEFSVLMGEKLHIPTKQKRRSTGQSTKRPLDHQRPEKMEPGWHLRPRAFAPQASVMTAGVRDDAAMSIPVSCDGVKTHVFMDDSIGFSGRPMTLGW